MPEYHWNHWIDPIVFPYILPVTQIALTGEVFYLCLYMFCICVCISFFYLCLYHLNHITITVIIAKITETSTQLCFRKCLQCGRRRSWALLQHLQTLQQESGQWANFQSLMFSSLSTRIWSESKCLMFNVQCLQTLQQESGQWANVQFSIFNVFKSINKNLVRWQVWPRGVLIIRPCLGENAI